MGECCEGQWWLKELDAMAKTPDQRRAVAVVRKMMVEQHQGEPVAWLTKCKQSGLVEQAEPNEKASNPEHWTDAFPVYDSPKSARSQFDYDRGFAAGTAECETLRAKLAERDALLRYVDDQLTNMQPHIEQACYPGRAGFIDNYVDPVIERIRALSASAEPSASTEREAWALQEEKRLGIERLPVEPCAPVEIDERAAFEAWAKEQGLSVSRTPQALCFYNGMRRATGDYIDLSSLCSYAAWQARAALERKP